MKFFKQLMCHHDFKSVIKIGDWFPTFHTTNGLDDEDERILVFKCDECGKRLTRRQVRSHGRLVNYKYIKLDGDEIKFR